MLSSSFEKLSWQVSVRKKEKRQQKSSTGHVCCWRIFKAGVNSSRCPNKLREHPETQNLLFFFFSNRSICVMSKFISPPLTLRKRRRHKFLDLTWQWPLFLLIIVFLSKGGNAGFSFLVVIKTVFPSLSFPSIKNTPTHGSWKSARGWDLRSTFRRSRTRLGLQTTATT